MPLTFEQFHEIVVQTLDQFLSRDTTLVQEDIAWENENFTNNLARSLRVKGVTAPSPD